MRTYLSVLFLAFVTQVLIQCGSKTQDPKQLFSIEISPKKTTYTLGDTLSYTLGSKTDLNAHSISWQFDGVPVEEQHSLADLKLGKHFGIWLSVKMKCKNANILYS